MITRRQQWEKAHPERDKKREIIQKQKMHRTYKPTQKPDLRFRRNRFLLQNGQGIGSKRKRTKKNTRAKKETNTKKE